MIAALILSLLVVGGGLAVWVTATSRRCDPSRYLVAACTGCGTTIYHQPGNTPLCVYCQGGRNE